VLRLEFLEKYLVSKIMLADDHLSDYRIAQPAG